MIKFGGLTVKPAGIEKVFLGSTLVYQSAITKFLSGTLPLTITDATTASIISLTQYGKCSQATTPSPSAPVDIKCNNGALKYGKPITINNTRITAFINTEGKWYSSSDSYSIAIPVVNGKKYAIRMTETDSAIVSTILRWGFSTTNVPGTTSSSAVLLTNWVRTSPQETPYAEVTASGTYLIIQMAAGKFADVIDNGYLTLHEQAFYTDGTPEVLTVSASGAEDQNASVTNLLAVGNFEDTQDVISGAVRRKVGIAVFDGNESWSRISDTRYQLVFSVAVANSACMSSHFIYSTSTSGAGKIRIASSGYLQVVVEATTLTDYKAFLSAQYAAGTPVIVIYPLATETTESVTGQSLSTVDGTNIISATAEVSGIKADITYS